MYMSESIPNQYLVIDMYMYIQTLVSSHYSLQVNACPVLQEELNKVSLAVATGIPKWMIAILQ